MGFDYHRNSVFVFCTFDDGEPFFTHLLIPQFSRLFADERNIWFIGALRDMQ